MPDIICPECSAQVSGHAIACPQCGHHFVPVEQEGAVRRTFRISWMMIAGLVLIIGLFALISTCHWKPV